MVSREDENCIYSTIVIIKMLRRGTTFSWTSALVSYLFFLWKKCPYAWHCPALRIVDYQSHCCIRKLRLRTAAFNIPECPLERFICEIASDIVFLLLCFNDSNIKSSGVF